LSKKLKLRFKKQSPKQLPRIEARDGQLLCGIRVRLIQFHQIRILDKTTNHQTGTYFGEDDIVFYESKIDSNGITVKIPMVKRNENFHITVVSKENKIFTDEATYSYQNDYIIEIYKLIIWGFALWVLMIIFCGVFKKARKK
jgi:hypothetical protein